ncbi:M28 family metallopeptidase [Pontibacter anaerobius]|uniref:M28 family peptidase n=1 Tax=Pontibacter anaerobius TaxID=2993940 RepID=A0ABT3RK92_9BACT|nr:M28 family peptidase [Pontibacter anaerobius]MCX2742114.1 M28 family peptidase [Pontibacter anaerobius]
MNKIFTFLLTLCLAAPTLLQAQDMARARQTLDTLTSQSMYGRGYTFEGDLKAALYIKNRFDEMGLQPLEGQSYFQEFSFPVNRIVKTPQLQVNGRTLVPGQDFVARSSSASGAGKAKVLPLDTLVFTDARVAQKFFRKNFTNKALVYPQQEQKRLAQLPAPYQQKLQQAKVHIILQPKSLLTTVAKQQEAVPVLEVLQNAWPQQAEKVYFTVQADLNPQHQTQNVIGFIPGSQQPDSVLVFSAHYDHLGSQGKEVYFPGANDNASGTTMLLELAQHYSRPENQPKYSMVFIAFAAEEAGLLGSFHYVQNPLFPLQQISFLLNLDLLGTGDEGLMVVNGKVHEQEFGLLQRLNEQHHYLPQIKSRGKAANSDHYPFSEAGVPAFFFYTLGGTAAYHNPQDHAAQLPLTKFPEVFKLITSFAEALMADEINQEEIN